MGNLIDEAVDDAPAGNMLNVKRTVPSQRCTVCVLQAVVHSGSLSEEEKLLYAKQLHTNEELDSAQQVSFTSLTSFEKQLNVKIVISPHCRA